MKRSFVSCRVLSFLASSILFAVVTTTHATTISYAVTSLGGNSWQYSYSVANDSLSSNIEEFTIYFEQGDFENLRSAQAPLEWDPTVIQPDPLLPDDGFYDGLSNTLSIAPGETLTGFTIQFDYFGSDMPGSQFFEIINATNFSVLDSGTTTVVPIPAAVWLLGSGIFSLFFVARGSKKSDPLVDAKPA